MPLLVMLAVWMVLPPLTTSMASFVPAPTLPLKVVVPLTVRL